MESRNPYAPPQAPVVAEPQALSGDPAERPVGGFWLRVVALILDSLILAPLAILYFVLSMWSMKAALYFGLPSDLLGLWYYVYLVKRFGGTPGKRILGLRIVMADGREVTGQAAFLRYLPAFVFSVISSIASMVGLSQLEAGVTADGFLDQLRLLGSAQPAWAGIVTWIAQAFWLATAITMLSNTRRRAIHDFIAGTAVVRD